MRQRLAWLKDLAAAISVLTALTVVTLIGGIAILAAALKIIATIFRYAFGG